MSKTTNKSSLKSANGRYALCWTIKALERENRELRQANEILRKASAYFAQAGRVLPVSFADGLNPVAAMMVPMWHRRYQHLPGHRQSMGPPRHN